ncbi:Polypyrimidine tract-binding protein 2 [Frankliniella fusca]|uniref:Polypyrimidine tract-binding protein 2 n=1 Tax=Frankliniella fusca TaxID=407009 RepID=A0AAE1I229_9NEOP|nr:Polypyrimidine tract-binding protein 2 [Frankliniella fusca]
MNRFLIIFAVLAAMVATLAMAAPSGVSDSGMFRNPGSPTDRRVIKFADGTQSDATYNHISGQSTTGFHTVGTDARKTSPERQGQKSSGGEASTSKKGKGKGKGK